MSLAARSASDRPRRLRVAELDVSGQSKGAGRKQKRTIMPDACSRADDLPLVLLEVDDGATAQAEDRQARNILRRGRIRVGIRRDVFVVDLDFEFRPGELAPSGLDQPGPLRTMRRSRVGALTASPLLICGDLTLSQQGPMILRSTTKRSKGVAVEPNTCVYISPVASIGMSASLRLPTAARWVA